MCRSTFEQALRTVFQNSRFSRIVEGCRPSNCWRQVLREDSAEVTKTVKQLCSDLSLIAGCRIKCLSQLMVMTEPPMPCLTEEQAVHSCWPFFTRAINRYINKVVNNIANNHQNMDYCMFPISKVFWNKGTAKTVWPDAMNRPQYVTLEGAKEKNVQDVDSPRHIRKILDNCEKTHFDYQPYVIEGKDGRILVVRLGTDWPDLVVARWNKPSFNILVRSNPKSVIQDVCLALSAFVLSGVLLGIGFAVPWAWLWAIMFVVSMFVFSIGATIVGSLVHAVFKPLCV